MSSKTITIDQRIDILSSATKVAISQVKDFEEVYRRMLALVASEKDSPK
jgi:hypothetical protein